MAVAFDSEFRADAATVQLVCDWPKLSADVRQSKSLERRTALAAEREQLKVDNDRLKQKIAKARHRAAEKRSALAAEGKKLRDENDQLRSAMERAKERAEAKLKTKQVENMTMMADNDALRQLVLEARELSVRRQKARIALKAGQDLQVLGLDWDEMLMQKAICQNKLRSLMPRPVRTAPGEGMDSPRTATPTCVSPRLDLARHFCIVRQQSNAGSVIRQDEQPSPHGARSRPRSGTSAASFSRSQSATNLHGVGGSLSADCTLYDSR